MEIVKLSDICYPKQWKTIPTGDLLKEGYPVYGANGIIGYWKEYNHEQPVVAITCRGATCGNVKLTLPKAYVTGNAMCLENVKSDIDLEYLYFCLLQYDFKKVISGSAQPQITRQALEKVNIKLVDYLKQKQIVKKLKRIISIIEFRKQQLHKLDELIQARFVEMFGNESNPKAWEIVNVESVADVQVGVVIKPSQYYTDAIDGIKAFRSLNVGEGFIKDDNWVYFTKEGHKRNAKSALKENDLLIVRSGAPGTACVVTKEYEGCNAIDIIIAHPNCEKVNPYYLCTYTNMPHGKKQINEGTGGAAQQHFNVTKYNKLQLMLPPMKLQDEFVTFVNQVHKSKVEIQQALEKTQLLFDSLMQQYFG